MILTTSDRFLSLPLAALRPGSLLTPHNVPNASPCLTKCRRVPRDAQCTFARRSSFMRVGLGAMPDEFGKVMQIKVTIQ